MIKNISRFWCARTTILLAFFGLLATASLLAQTSSTGALGGRITDPSGAVVAGATVTLTSLGTGQARTTTTAADGTYNFSLLPPGNYSLRIEAAGFKAVDVPSVTVSVTETAALDRSLEVGTQTQTVTVEGSVEAVQTTSSALGTVAPAETVTDLPLNTRNYTNLLSMTAGANANVENASTIGKGSVYIAVNGAGFGQNTYLQDGVSVDSWFSFNTGTEGKSNASFPIPNPDTISEFKIQTSSYDASFGRNPGANVNVVTKSGTNNWHGSGFEFFRNTSLNANSWFNNVFGEPKGILNSNQYGGTLGGPIKKDKLFFFVSYQETHQTNGITSFGQSTPTLPPIPNMNRGTCPAGWTALSQCDAAAQAFVPALANAMCYQNHPSDPTLYQTNKDQGIQVLCAPTPAAPLANINPVAISILQLKNGAGYLVPGSGTSDYATAQFIAPAIFKDHNAIANLDYVLNAKNTISTRYEYEEDPQYDGIASQDANTAVGVFLPGEPGEESHSNQDAVVRLTTVLTGNSVNQAIVSYQRLVTSNSELTPYTNSSVGIADLQPGLDQLSYITTPDFALGAFYQYGTYNPVNQFQVTDQYSWEHGKHNIRTGFGVEHIQAQTYFPGHAAGNLSFQTVSDFLIGRAGCNAFTGVGTCSLTNAANTNGTGSSNFTSGSFGALNSTFSGYWHVNEVNAFVQDDFKALPRLTFNVGVRWEYDGDVTENRGLMSTLWTSQLSTVPVPGSSPQTGSLAGFVVPANYSGPAEPGLFVNSNDSLSNPAAPKHDFAPRGGFAWQPISSPRWVVRGGGGMFYDVLPGNTILNMLEVAEPALISPVTSPTTASLANPFQLQTPVYPGPNGTAGWTTRWVDANPATPISVLCPSPSAANPCSSNISQAVIPQDFKVPVTYEWNLNTQYEFANNWVVELAYVGSHGINQAPQSREGLQGQASAQQGFNMAQLAGVNCTICSSDGVSTNTVSNVPLRVPYLGVAANDTALLENASYKYNAAQITVRKQMSKGLEFQADYTYARGFITQPFGINTAPFIVETYEPNNNYHPQRLVFSYIWNLPVPHFSGWRGEALDGWSWSGVTTIQDGVPLTILDTGGQIFFGQSGANFATAQLCPGMTYSNLLTSGSLTDRVASGLVPGGAGYLNGHAQGVLCALPTIGATPGVAGTGGTGFGNTGGGAVLGPGQNNWDMALAKNFPIHEAQTLLFRAEFFNAFNHAQFNIPNINANQSTFGQITGLVVSPRVIQLALKYQF